MTGYANYERLLASFGELLGFEEALTPDGEGMCLLQLDGSTELTLACPPGAGDLLHIYSDLGPAPFDLSRRSVLYREMLQANQQLVPEHAASFALELTTGSVILSASRPVAELTQGDFEDFLETLLNLAETWRQKISQSPGEEAEPAILSDDVVILGSMRI